MFCFDFYAYYRNFFASENWVNMKLFWNSSHYLQRALIVVLTLT